MKTKVINLFSGAGAGKSTLAAGLYYKMKTQGINVELVTEFIKTMAWENIKPGLYDQPFIFGSQVKSESRLYNKVDFVITDSPLLLSPIYEIYYNNYSLTESSALSFLNLTHQKEIEHINFFLERTYPFSNKGRYETESQAKEVDVLIKKKLEDWKIPFFIIDKHEVNRVEYILDKVNNYKETQ